jgi:UDP-glucose 4-epimerase
MAARKKAAPKKAAAKKKKASTKKKAPKTAKKTAKKKAANKAAKKKPARARKRTGLARRERVLVTGAAGALGQMLVRKLHRSFEVIGVDRRPFPDRPKDVEHHRIDLRRKSALQLLRKKKPDLVIHLGVMHDPRKEASHQALHYNLDVMNQMLRFAEQLEVRKFLFLSTANLYGPSATSSAFLTEESPLLGAGRSPMVRDLISLDMMVQSFFWKRPETETVILRPVHIVGPHVHNAPSNYLRKKSIITLLGFDPMIQIVHELDVVDALIAGLNPGVRGIFNVVGAGQAPLSRLIEARGALQVPLPEPVLSSALERAFKMRLSTFPASELVHLKYSCLVDGSRARDALGFSPRYSLKQTVTDVD